MTPAPVPQSAPPSRVVTISAAYGAGGAVVAPLLARRLGLPFADRLVDPLGASPGRSQEQVSEEELDQEPRGLLMEGLALLGATWNLPTSPEAQDVPQRLRAAVEQSIAELVASGGAVVLGRAAAAALGRRAGAFHVRLDGPQDRRAQRGAAWEGVDLASARTRMAKADAVRSRYVQRLYGRDATDPSLYHLVVDATAMMVDPLVDLIAAAADASWAYDDSQLGTEIATVRSRLMDPPASDPPPFSTQ